jgi:hypothetical protein
MPLQNTPRDASLYWLAAETGVIEIMTFPEMFCILIPGRSLMR